MQGAYADSDNIGGKCRNLFCRLWLWGKQPVLDQSDTAGGNKAVKIIKTDQVLFRKLVCI